MRSKKLLRVLAATAVLVVAALGGAWLGNTYGNRRAAGARKAKKAELDVFLRQHIKGIAVGEPFPDLALWSADGQRAYHLRELLPEGGVLFFFAAECRVCQDAVAALCNAMRALDGGARPVVVATGAHPDALLEAMTERGIDLPLYCDMQESLRRDHKMQTARTYFVLDSAGVLTAMGTREVDPAEYMDVIAEAGTHNGVGSP